MSHQSNGNPIAGSRRNPSELPACRDLVTVDCSALARAIDLLEQGQLNGDSVIALLRHELAAVQRQAERADELVQSSMVELRQLRESAQQQQVHKQDEHRQLQDQNDRFVANLIHDHETELTALRRERDAAIDRVRELSRGITRVGAGTSANPPQTSRSVESRSASDPSQIAELKARIDELLFERERSLRLLRQLAEQRDQAESRLHATLAAKSAARSSSSQNAVARQPTPPSGAAVPRVARPLVQQSTTQQAATATVSTATSGTVPNAGDLARPSQPTLGELETPDSWEPPRSSNTAGTVESGVAKPSSRAGASETNRSDPDGSKSASRRAITGEMERAGAYSMHSDEIIAQEIVVFRGPRSDPKRP